MRKGTKAITAAAGVIFTLGTAGVIDYFTQTRHETCNCRKECPTPIVHCQAPACAREHHKPVQAEILRAARLLLPYSTRYSMMYKIENGIDEMRAACTAWGMPCVEPRLK